MSLFQTAARSCFPHCLFACGITLTSGQLINVMFRGPSFIVSTMQEETTPIFKRLWYDWTQQQPGIEPTNPLGQCWVPPIIAFYDQQGLLRTYLSQGGSITVSKLGVAQQHPYQLGIMSGKSRRTFHSSHRSPNMTTSENQRQIRKMDLNSGSSGGEWEDDVPLAILRDLQGIGDEFEYSIGKSDTYDSNNQPDLPTTIQMGEQRWVRVPQGTMKPTPMKPFEDLFVCGISLTSRQLINQLFPDCTRSCFSKVILCRRGGDRIYEMRYDCCLTGIPCHRPTC